MLCIRDGSSKANQKKIRRWTEMWHVGAWIQIQRYQYQALKKVYQPITDLEYIGDRTHARKISPLKTWSLTQRVDSNHVLLDIKKHMVGTVCAFPRWPPCPPHSNGMLITRLTICYEFETCASQTSRANRSTAFSTSTSPASQLQLAKARPTTNTYA